MSTAVGDRIRSALGVTVEKNSGSEGEEKGPQSPLWIPDPSSRRDKSLVRALRILLVVVLVVLVLTGLRQLLFPRTGGTAATTSPAVTFPVEQAGAVATRFADSYLTLNASAGEGGRKNRDTALALDAAPDVDTDGNWNGAGQIDVRDALPSGVQVSADGRRATATVLASVESAGTTSWIALAVPLGLDGSRVVVADAPAFVGFPATGEVTGERTPAGPAGVSPDLAMTETDSALSESTRGTGTAFLKALAGSDPAALAQATAPGAQVAPLGGFVQFDSLTSWTVLVGDDSTRSAVAAVVWRDPSGGLLRQTYTLTLAAVSSGTSTDWRVQQLTVNTTSTPASNNVSTPEGENP